MDKIKVVLADDQILFVQSLKTVLEMRAKDIKVVGIAGNGNEAIQRVEDERPDIVLMDVRMPELDGVEATKMIHKRFPETQIMMLTTFDDDEYVYEALLHGAVGYLLKNIPPNELITSIRAIKEGNVLISPAVAQKLVKNGYFMVNKAMEKRRDGKSAAVGPSSAGSFVKGAGYREPSWLKDLSNREKEVLKLIVDGKDNKEIAEKLYLGEQTVKNYVSFIYSKTGAHDRVHLIKLMLEKNITL